ncbi:histidine kinase, partial [Desulfobulbus sp. F4]|nr:histidine kinase [Desulfobulbus sp. F4]
DFVDKSPPVKETTPVYPMIVKSLMLFYNAMQKQRIDYEIIISDRQLKFELDQQQIKRIFVHLIRNAVEAMEQGGKLIIEVLVLNGQLRAAVRDSGIGIAEADIRRAADPFYTTKTIGTGIGLALVKRVITEHGGSLSIRRREGGGTEVSFTLPNS